MVVGMDIVVVGVVVVGVGVDMYVYVGGYLRVYMYVYGVWVGGICN